MPDPRSDRERSTPAGHAPLIRVEDVVEEEIPSRAEERERHRSPRIPSPRNRSAARNAWASGNSSRQKPSDGVRRPEAVTVSVLTLLSHRVFACEGPILRVESGGSVGRRDPSGRNRAAGRVRRLPGIAVDDGVEASGLDRDPVAEGVPAGKLMMWVG